MKYYDIETYKYNGARSLIILHDKHLRSCINTWHIAKSLNISLPETTDKDYKSLEALLCHILRASRGYMIWMCNKLNLPDPNIRDTPSSENVETVSNVYLDHILDKWRIPLKDVDEKYFHDKAYLSNWGIPYCIDAMLEHAVMHPIRHEYQLNTLINEINNK